MGHIWGAGGEGSREAPAAGGARATGVCSRGLSGEKGEEQLHAGVGAHTQ